MTTRRLGDEVHHTIIELLESGNRSVDAGDLDLALQYFNMALELLPEPYLDLDESTPILAAIGETHLFRGEYQAALDRLREALKCPGGLGNALIHFRLGQAFYELGIMDESADQLVRAFMADGSEVFDDEDPKYMEFLRSRIDIDA